MGHGVVLFENRIWVMGGCDGARNPLNDVWTFDPSSWTWEKKLATWTWNQELNKWTPDGQADSGAPKETRWEPRCLIGPAVFDGEIRLFGGAGEPGSDLLFHDMWAWTGDRWKERKMTEILFHTDAQTGVVEIHPIASALQVLDGQLHLFWVTRRVARGDASESMERFAYRLAIPETKTWEKIPGDDLQIWGPRTTFSCQLVSYQGRLLIARALGPRTSNPEPRLKVYVIEPSDTSNTPV
jgi:hypothetical protein